MRWHHSSLMMKCCGESAGEYIEMPGLRLTTAQAQRLWGLDRASCDALLDALVDAKFLFRTRDGAFVRSEHIRVAELKEDRFMMSGSAGSLPGPVGASPT